MIRDAYIQQQLTGKRIISNMSDLNPDYFNFEFITLDDFMNMVENNVGLNDCILLLDELHIWLDSRTSMSKRNRTISYFALQTRKEDVDLYYTTQYLIQVDIRIRNLTTHLVECYTQEHPVAKEQLTLNIVRIRKINRMVTQKLTFWTRLVYELYNTKEIIKG